MVENKSMVLPNLFIVGAPKCGTSALYSYLKQHPDVFMSERKEPQFFCKDFWKESDVYHGRKKFFSLRSQEEYLRLFKNVKKEKVLGEATSKYLYSKVAVKNIYKFNPDSKIIIMLRDPVDFLYSYHSQCIYDSVEDELDFKIAMDLEESRKKGRDVPIHTPVPSFAYYSDIATFSEQILRYKQFFPDGNIKIIFHDDLKNKPEVVYKEVLNFLKIKPNHSPNFEIVNPNKKIISIRLNNALNSYSKIFLTYLPMKAYMKLRSLYYKINIEYSTRSSLDDKLKLELMHKFHPEIKMLSKVLNKDLSLLWGYDKLE